MASSVPSINLARRSKGSFFDRFIRWSLTIGRLIIILTEAVALSAFLYRFSLDRQLIDFHDKIKQKQTIVSNFKRSEETYRNLQDRLFLSQQLENQGKENVKIFSDVISFAPQDLIFNNLSVSKDSIKIDITLQSVSSLSRFVNTLKTYTPIKTISVDKIENKTSLGIISVAITATLKNAPNNQKADAFSLSSQKVESNN